ncbi:hypothetical protein [Streptomyces sp. NBC_00503]|uniref:hypothetical protein n=1 Tax=Streptomyces sp. NBC_00503 TaxID=2903659 RepID=UPI002E81632D|nr:hypothetical protein [Streptomyces sp. NBC_00503]WUD84491.1 hypothetical protein OG490_30200 [Streptomyces sp. NBC_00503]
MAGLRPGESVDIPVNPAYTAPPGTPAELSALRERIAATRRTRAELAGTEGRMVGQAAARSSRDAQLGRAGEVSQQLIEGGRAQDTATRATGSTNRERQATAAGALDGPGRSAQQAGAVATPAGSGPARMRAWAGGHRAARESALAAARERLTAQGYAVREGG